MTAPPAKPDWNTRYDRPDYLFGTAPSAFLLKHARHLPATGTALAVADGEGRNSVWLAERGLAVTAFDSSERGLEKARALAGAHGVEVAFQHADILTYDWSGTQYDVIAALFFQFLAPDQRGPVFRGLDAALKPGGLLLLHGFAPRQVEYGTGGPPHRANMYTLPLLRAAFPRHEILHQEDYDEVVDSGEGHNGLAALVDFVARKPTRS